MESEILNWADQRHLIYEVWNIEFSRPKAFNVLRLKYWIE